MYIWSAGGFQIACANLQKGESMRQNYRLMYKDTSLGVLTPYEDDFPWVYCHFEAELSFAALQPLFDAEQQAFETDHRDVEKWEKLYEPISALNLYLLGDDGKKIEEMLLHITDGQAWFRY
jgi:hypothetical protein